LPEGFCDNGVLVRPLAVKESRRLTNERVPPIEDFVVCVDREAFGTQDQTGDCVALRGAKLAKAPDVASLLTRSDNLPDWILQIAPLEELKKYQLACNRSHIARAIPSSNLVRV
jgi:hypothetical protein